MSIINALLTLNQEAIGTYYPFISDAPTSSFDPSTTHKYLMGIKDIFGQSIIMTKDVEVGSDKYNDLYNQDKVSHIFNLKAKSYREDIERTRNLGSFNYSKNTQIDRYLWIIYSKLGSLLSRRQKKK